MRKLTARKTKPKQPSEPTRRLIFTTKSYCGLPPRLFVPYGQDAAAFLAQKLWEKRSVKTAKRPMEETVKKLERIRKVLQIPELHKSDGKSDSPEFWSESMMRRIADTCIASALPLEMLDDLERVYTVIGDALSIINSGQSVFGTYSGEEEREFLFGKVKSLCTLEGLEAMYHQTASKFPKQSRFGNLKITAASLVAEGMKLKCKVTHPRTPTRKFPLNKLSGEVAGIRIFMRDANLFDDDAGRMEALCTIAEICSLTAHPIKSLANVAEIYRALHEVHSLSEQGFTSHSREGNADMEALARRLLNFCTHAGLAEVLEKAWAMASNGSGRIKIPNVSEDMQWELVDDLTGAAAPLDAVDPTVDRYGFAK